MFNFRPRVSGRFGLAFTLIVATFGTSVRAQNENEDDGTAEKIVEGFKVTVRVLERWLSHHPTVKFDESNACMLPLSMLVDSNGNVEESRVSNDLAKQPFTNCRIVKVEFIDVRLEDINSVKVTIMADKSAGLGGSTGSDQPRSVAVEHNEIVAVAAPTNEDHDYYIGRLKFKGGSEKDRAEFFQRNPNAKVKLTLDPPGAEGVILCQDRDYKGKALWVPVDGEVPSISKRCDDKDHDMNDEFTSVLVLGHCKATLFWDSKFRGKSIDVDSNTPSLEDRFGNGWDNDASSVKVTK